MSFATRSKSRERNAFQGGLAHQPQKPVQKEPLHRYGSGIIVPGVSMKGSHMFEGVVVDGRAVPTRLNASEKPTNLLRSSSPLSLTRPEVAKTDRSVRSKSPLPQTLNTFSQSRAGSPLSVSGANGGGSGNVAPNRTFLEISAKNISTLNRQSSDNASVGSYRSINSNNRPNSASSVSSRSYASSTARSQLRKSDSFSIIENIQQLNQLETRSLTSRRSASPSLLKSLSQTKNVSSSPAIHNIQLTQGAYKNVRRSNSQDNILDFMTFHKESTAAEDMGAILDTIGDEGRQYIQNLFNTTSPLAKSLSEFKNTSPLSGTVPTSPSNLAEIKRIKKLIHLSKMCKDEIDREMVYYTSHNAYNLFFPIENEKSPMVLTTRLELYRIIENQFIPILNDNLTKIREAENLVLNHNKTEMNELHATINNKEEELQKLIEANNKLKKKIARLCAKHDVLSYNNNNNVTNEFAGMYGYGGERQVNEFQATVNEMFGPTFTNTMMEQLRNPHLCALQEVFGHSAGGAVNDNNNSLGFPEHPEYDSSFDESDAPHNTNHGEHYEEFQEEVQEEVMPPAPPVDRFAVNFDVIQQLADISPQVPTRRVAPDPNPVRKYPASPFVQQHVPNAIVQSVLQGYKSPYQNKGIYRRHLHNVSMSTITSTPSAVLGSSGGGHGISPQGGLRSQQQGVHSGSFHVGDLMSSPSLQYTATSSPPPYVMKGSGGGSPAMHPSVGINSIPNHHVKSQQLYRRSVSPTTIHTHVGTAGTVSGVTSGVSPTSLRRPVSPAYNARQEVITTPEHQEITYAKVDYRQLNSLDSYQANKEAHRLSPKMMVRSPPKVPIPNFSTQNKETNSFGKSMMEVMLNSTY